MIYFLILGMATFFGLFLSAAAYYNNHPYYNNKQSSPVKAYRS